MSKNTTSRPFLRAQSRQYRLSRALSSTKRTVKMLDHNRGGTTDSKILLSLVTTNETKERQLRWAFELQTMKGQYVNYLSGFFQQLEEHNKKLANKFRQYFKDMGVAISPSSGHFHRLDHLDPNEVVPKQPLDPKVRNILWNKYVDTFTQIDYDVSYRRFKGDTLSYFLQATYSDGVTVDVDWRTICDNWDPASKQSMAYAFIGVGGRLYPLRMSRQTTPRLWDAKYDVALKKIGQSNLEFSNLVAISIAGVLSNLPIGPVVHPVASNTPTSISSPRSGRVRVRQHTPNSPRFKENTGTSNQGINNRQVPNRQKLSGSGKPAAKQSQAAVVDAATAAKAANDRKFAQAAAQHPDSIYHRFMNEGGVREVAAKSEIKAGSGTGMFGGGEQARAWFGPAPDITNKAVIEFTTTVPGGARNTVGSKNFAYWTANDGVNYTPHLKGSDLKITIRRIVYPDGTVARPVGSRRFQIAKPDGTTRIINVRDLPDK